MPYGCLVLPRRATGPPRSGAGEGVGILRGTIMFDDLKDSKIWSSKNTEIPRPSKFVVQKHSVVFQKYGWFNRIYLCLKIIHNYSRFTKISPSQNFVFLKTLGEANCFGPKKITIYLWCPGGHKILIPKLSKSPNSKISFYVL